MCPWQGYIFPVKNYTRLRFSQSLCVLSSRSAFPVYFMSSSQSVRVLLAWISPLTSFQAYWKYVLAHCSLNHSPTHDTGVATQEKSSCVPFPLLLILFLQKSTVHKEYMNLPKKEIPCCSGCCCCCCGKNGHTNPTKKRIRSRKRGRERDGFSLCIILCVPLYSAAARQDRKFGDPGKHF